MHCVDTRAECYRGDGGAGAPVIYLIDLPKHPLAIPSPSAPRASSVVTVPVRDWGRSLTPWTAEGLRAGDPPFAGEAAETIDELRDRVIPRLEERWGLAPSRRALCGYSLGGLFSLYAFLRDDRLAACGCVSGSLWYDRWLGYLEASTAPLEGRAVYLSIGKRESRSGPRRMRCVQENAERTAAILGRRGCTVAYDVGPGNHMQHQAERLAAALAALDAWLARR